MSKSSRDDFEEKQYYNNSSDYIDLEVEVEDNEHSELKTESYKKQKRHEVN
ncbi:hypothetical protein TWF718_003476 [Orbilia javanica]|uniref:Uncharacterized protein n=1 Tax=Orbilia javanica TaxID=47235 RepID=A0AAN8MSV5_9PEZI